MGENSVVTKIAQLEELFEPWGRRASEKQAAEAGKTPLSEDWLIEAPPEVIDLVAKGWINSYVKYWSKGKAESKLKILQEMLVDAVEAYFPTLATAAQERAECTSDAAELRDLLIEILKALDEATALPLLHVYGRQ
jgi:hypothetical protein